MEKHNSKCYNYHNESMNSVQMELRDSKFIFLVFSISNVNLTSRNYITVHPCNIGDKRLVVHILEKLTCKYGSNFKCKMHYLCHTT